MTRREIRRMLEAQAAAAAAASSAQPEPEPEPAKAASEAEPSLADQVAFAARVLSFASDEVVPVDAGPVADPPPAPAAAQTFLPTEALRARPRTWFGRRIDVRRLAPSGASLAAMTVVGLFAIGATVPAAAFAGADRQASASVNVISADSAEQAATDEEIQAFVVPADAAEPVMERVEGYAVASMAQIAAASGVTNVSGAWVNDPTAEVQWPFPVGVPISAGYGSSAYQWQFSMEHRGTDFTPGAGAEVLAVAGGTVREATEAGGSFGVTVVIDHVIDGEAVSTRYAHLQYGSLKVAAGQTVTAGQPIGRVGSTGKSTGAHLHLEVLLGGTTHIDPLPWLREHAG